MSELSLFQDATADLFVGDMFAEGYSLPGFTEVEKSWLIGVPHIITKITFWVPKKGIGHCSVEAYVGTQAMLDRALTRTKVGGEAIGPDGKTKLEAKEAIVYSDGSTGIRRQIVRLLSSFGMIDVGRPDAPEDGKLGESRYDSPWVEWESFDQTGTQGNVTVPSFTLDHQGGPFRLKVLGGLTDSTYDNDYGDGTTYYLR